MRVARIVSAVAAVALVAAAVVPAAHARPASKKRVVELRYERPDPMVEGVGGICNALCGAETARKGERFLTVEAVDDVSLYVPVIVYQDFTGDGIPDQRNTMCQARGDRLKVRTRPFAQIIANVDVAPVYYRYPDDNRVCPGTPTSGTIRLTFEK